MATPSNSDPDRVNDAAAVDAVDVYWRPGCPFCMALRAQMKLAGIPNRRHNIWKDPTAAAKVRAVAKGNETVPTVFVGEHPLVNPSLKTLKALLAVEAPQLLT